MDFSQIVELFDQPAWVWSLTGAPVAANSALRAGNNAPFSDRDTRQAIIDAVVADPHLPLDRAVELTNAEGVELWFPCRFKPLLVDGAVAAIVGICARPPAHVGGSRQSSDDTIADTAHETEDGQVTADADDSVIARIAENAPAALFEFVAHADGTISLPFFNAKLAELFGTSIEEMSTNKSITFDRIHPEDQPRMLQSRARSIETGTMHDISYRVLHPERGTIWLHTRSVPRLRDDGATVFIGTVHDITSEKEAEAQARAAAEEAEAARRRLDLLLDYSPTAMTEYRISANGAHSFDYFSKGYPDVIGVPAEDLCKDATAAHSVVHEEDLQSLLNIAAQAHRDQTQLDFDHRIRHPDRGVRWLNIRSRPKRQPDGSTIMYGAVTDVTERMEANAREAAAHHEKERALHLLNEITESIPSGIARIRIQADGQRLVEYFNSGMCDLLGVTPEEMRDNHDTAFKNVHPDDAERLREIGFQAQTVLEPVAERFRVLHPERGEMWLYIYIAPHPQEDGSVIWYSNNFDISEQVSLEQEAKAAHDRVQRIADTVPVGLYETRQVEDGAQSLHFTSPRFVELAGLTATDPREKFEEFYDKMHAEDRDAVRATAQSSRSTLQDWVQRFRIHPEEGRTAWLQATASAYLDETGNAALVGALSDITADVEREQELKRAHALTESIRRENEHQALHDSLTGLPNRRYFDNRMKALFDQAQQPGGEANVTLVRVDGDRFKYINDTFGHEAGDAVLQRIGSVMQQKSRAQDFLARVGGDEFSILLSGDNNDARAAALIDRIRDGLLEPLIFQGNRCSIQASFGVATVDARVESQDDLLMFADAALYRAKEQGRNRMELFTPELRHDIIDSRQIIADLHTAIERDEIEPYFQVQVDSHTQRVTGAEALMRWNHPNRGLMMPDSFLHLADKLRITSDLDRQMKLKTHQRLLDLRTQGLELPRISFNASASGLRGTEIVKNVKGLLDDGFGVALELLESIMIESEDDEFRFTLDLLRDVGIELEIDDFGSGRASVLGLLEVSPVALKIDKRLIFGVETEASACKLVRAIVDIAEALDISTICEGVETEEQITTLQALGCKVMQGYYYSRPVPLTELARLLRDPPWTITKQSLKQA